MRGLCAAVCAAMLAMCPLPARAQQPAAVRALLVSDVHFEAFWDPGKAEKLAASPVEEWPSILESAASPDRAARFAALEKSCPGRGEDTPYPLLASSVRAMKLHASGASFIVLSGDLVAHEFDCKYETLFPREQPGDYRAFVEKTMTFVIAELRRAAPGIAVYAALGNNDSDCGDYQLDPNGPFMSRMDALFTQEVPQRERAAARESFRAGGYYSTPLPAPMKNARLVVLNDVFLSPKHADCAGKRDPAPGAVELEWLKRQLAEAKAAGENVWVMGHIPPGVDAFSTLKHMKLKCNAGPPVMFLSNDQLAQELENAGSEIRLAIFAHAHTDEFKLLEPGGTGGDAGKAIAVKMVPSISPINGNEPAFTVAKVDPATAELTDYAVFANANADGAGAWTELYDFDRTYGEKAFNASAVRQVLERLSAKKSDASQSYMSNFLTGRPDVLLPLVWPQYVCTLSHTTASAYENCACPAAAPDAAQNR